MKDPKKFREVFKPAIEATRKGKAGRGRTKGFEQKSLLSEESEGTEQSLEAVNVWSLIMN